MAVDSKQKRSSAIGLRQAWLPVLPDADGSLDQGDRQDTAFSYMGILSSSPSITKVSKVVTAFAAASLMKVASYTSTFTVHGFKVLTARAD